MATREQFEASIPAEGGVYVLILCQAAPGLRLRVGALGEVNFAPGYYCYAGSALGGLRARLGRHLRGDAERPRWHVDYLRRRAPPAGAVWWTGGRRAECELNRRIARLADGSVPGFGCSDCRCESHLHYFARDPRVRLRVRAMGPPRAVRWPPAPGQ